jgi:hypothetical protein
MRPRLAALLMMGVVLAVTIPSARATSGIWLTAPADGATLASGEAVSFEFGTDWATGVFPGQLGLQISRDPGFTDLVVDDVFACPASFEPSCPSTAVRGPLEAGHYHWRIRWYSRSEDGTTSWVPSDSWTFGVGSTPPAAPPNQPPVARIAFTPSRPHPGEVVTFDGSGSTDADGAIASYTWTFGNGNGAGGSPSVGASYSEAGTYHVRLVVVDDGGELSEATTDVVVERPSPSVPATTPVTSPVAPSAAPLAYALASTGRTGTRVKLWYRLAHVSSAARVEATVRLRQRVLATLRADVAGALPRTRYLVWRAPKVAQRLRFCVRVSIAPGGTSPISCAPLQLR